MNYYLLIVNDCWDDRGNKISAKNVAQHRLSRGLWNIYSNTPHRKLIKAGDSVIIYLAGTSEGGRAFLATAKVQGITSDPKSLSELYGEPPASALMLEDIAVFPESPKIADIKDELEFVPKNNPKWGCVMQRGAKIISKKDYERIVTAGNFAVSS